MTRRSGGAASARSTGSVDAIVAEAARFQAKDNLQAILLDASTPARWAGPVAERRATWLVPSRAASRSSSRAAWTRRTWPRRSSTSRPSGSTFPAAWSLARDARPGRATRPDPADRGPRRPARQGPLAVALFVKRAAAARVDRPTVPFGPQPVDPGLLEADAHGRWGVDARLRRALRARDAHGRSARPGDRLRAHPRRAGVLGRAPRAAGAATSAGRRRVYRADRLAAELERRAGREPGRLRLYLKREDLDHTGAHKINNALGQALLTRRLGKPRVIAETGAGQHGVATATACALLGLDCVVYMGAEDIRRQAPNVLRMRALGRRGARGDLGTATLKDAVNEAMRDWVTNVARRHYVLGSVVGPHPYPDDRARPPAGHRRRGRRADAHARRAACRTWPSPASAAARTPSAC